MDAGHHPHVRDDSVLQPFKYLNSIPGKDIRGEMIDCFASWIPLAEHQLRTIKEIVRPPSSSSVLPPSAVPSPLHSFLHTECVPALVLCNKQIGSLHNASLLVDDIEDSSKLRRGVPVAHSIYGVANTINCANYVYFLALEQCTSLNCPRALHVFVQELLNLHRGQGQDILWREECRCPTEEQYRQMVLDKTGGLFRLAVGLMQAIATSPSSSSSSGGNGGGSSSSSSSGTTSGADGGNGSTSHPSPSGDGGCTAMGSAGADFTTLLNRLALYFQIRDDFLNVSSVTYMQTKSFCEDLTEGKFSFPIIHAVLTRPGDTRLLNILRQRTEDVDVKRHAVQWMVETGSIAYTRATLRTLKDDVMNDIELLGGHPRLAALLNKLDAQLDAEGAAADGGAGAESL
jgi:geranylgeranyl diphosphate synthase type 3